MNLHLKDRKQLTNLEVKKLLELLTSTWPPKDGKIDMDKMIEDYKNESLNLFNKVLLFFNRKELVGHTEIFNREIIIEGEKKQILALAGVCLKPSFRGKDLGFKIVKKAFEFVDNGKFICSIFQTNVPVFYNKIHCRQIHNTFINSKNKNDINIRPWKDPYVMVYPETYEMGNNIIDLNGDGY